MKLLLVSALAASCLCIGTASAETITFNGTILDTTCNVTGGSGTNGGTAGSFVVALPQISKTALSTAGATAGDTGFSVVIGAPSGQPGTCDSMNGKTAKLHWNINQLSIDAANNVLKNTGTATNVGVQLASANGSVVDLSNVASATNVGSVVSGGTTELNYVASYKAIAGAAGQGTVQTSLEYVVEYN
jgi:major type 1 subunit fimbrin (pilin)